MFNLLNMCIKKKKSISFLLGAGFSVNAGYPTGNELGKKILFTTAERVMTSFKNFYNEYDSNRYYVYFLEEILTTLKNTQEYFNYEIFYDRIKTDRTRFDKELKAIFQSFRAKYKDSPKENLNDYLFQLDEIYNLLVALYIKDTIPNVFCRDYYKKIVDLIISLNQDYIINVHTLNHDLLFEDLLGNGNYTDGFTKLNSGYYENIYHGTIPFYANDYSSSSIRLYKLHGSIDYFRTLKTYDPNQVHNYIKLPQSVCRRDVRYKNDRCIYDLHPDFLTGINFKQTRYNEKFYEDLHNIFVSNLKTADKLIIIGYSGNDKGINKHIRKKLDKNASCFVIDRSKNEAQNVIDRIWPCYKRKNKYAVSSNLENVKLSDFDESTYRN